MGRCSDYERIKRKSESGPEAYLGVRDGEEKVVVEKLGRTQPYSFGFPMIASTINISSFKQPTKHHLDIAEHSGFRQTKFGIS
jgi:hypothetical protein